MENDNFNAWLHGLYVYNAVATVMGNSFGKGNKLKYFEKPISLKPKASNMEERLKVEFGVFADRVREKLECS